MQPAARVAAAIEILDDIFAGVAAEKALTGWGRGHRFAGSKDRAAIRDHVFQALRCRASYGWLGGSDAAKTTGRAVMLGAMRATGQADAMFTGEGHAPHPVEHNEGERPLLQADRGVQRDMPDWLLTHFDAALGGDADTVLDELRTRAGVFLRVNAARSDAQSAMSMLAEEAIIAVAVSDIKNALQVIENERRVAQSQAYLTGVVELQDCSSQMFIAALGIKPGMRILDYCAGGGGKALAMAALGAKVTAHDIDPRRMADIAPRAARAGVQIETVPTDALADLAPFDLVLVDAPCSGSGTWRRTPAAKWDLTPERLNELTHMQDDVLQGASSLVGVGGQLIYATCSVFECENYEIIHKFIARSSSFHLVDQTLLHPRPLGDGFYFAQMSRAT